MAVLWTVTAQTNTYGVQVSIPGLTDVPDRTSQAIKRERRQSRSPSPLRPARRPRVTEEGSQRAGREMNERQGQRGKTTIRPEWRNVSNQNLKQHMICPDFNAAGCNAPSPSTCPRAALHRCSFVLSDGTFCGSNSHGKLDCPRRPENGGSSSRQARSSKGKGQGKDRGARSR